MTTFLKEIKQIQTRKHYKRSKLNLDIKPALKEEFEQKNENETSEC